MDPTNEQDPIPPRTNSRRWLIIVALLLLVAAGVGGWFVFMQPRVPEAAPVVDAGVVEVDAGPTLSLDEGDALLKKLAAGWSTDATFAKWLDALVLRQLVAATQAVAEGESPRTSVPFISIAGAFSVREEEVPAPPAPPRKKKQPKPPAPPPRAFIATESYARYDALAQVFGSIDAAAAGDAWSKVEPFCDAAFAEIARPGARFHDALSAAVKRLLQVTVPEGEIEVEAKGAIYVFKDPALESLSAAEKHLLRMGATNARVIQTQLRAFAEHANLDL